jgi:PAS domain S-box-containing protein
MTESIPHAPADLLTSLLADNPAAIDFKDRDGRYLRVSPACASLLGLRDPAAAVGMTKADFLSREAAELERRDEQMVMKTGRSILDIERREEHADGRVTWSLVSRQPLCDALGAIVGTIGSARDITRRKLADEALQGVNARLTSVITTQRELAASALDLNAVIQLVVERARELSEADGAAVLILDGGEVAIRAAGGALAESAGRRRPVENSIAGAALRFGRPLLIRDVATDPRSGSDGGSGSVICAPFFHGSEPAGAVEVRRATPPFEANERNVVALLASMLSTALSQAAEFTAKRAQVEALAHFEAIFDGAPVGIAMLTAEGAIVTSNPAFHDFFGYSAEELVGLRFEQLLYDDDAGRDLPAGRLERRFRRRDGSPAWADASLAPVGKENGESPYVVAMVQDVSARKQAEDERDRMEAELRLAQKLEAVGQLAAGVAHEINTPIQYIGDAMRFLQEAFDDLMGLDAAQQRLLAAADGVVDPELVAGVRAAEEHADVEYLRERVPAAIERSSGGLIRVSTIVTAMRAFAEPASNAIGPVDLNEAIRNTLVVAAHEYEAVADVETELEAIPAVRCDASELNHVLLNLVVNAAHAIAPGGRRGRIRVTTRQAGDQVAIAVTDDGCGMSPDVAERVFDPFFTTKDVGSGTGQGLTVARSIVERHGGTIELETGQDTGTTFRVTLPIGRAPIT